MISLLNPLIRRLVLSFWALSLLAVGCDINSYLPTVEFLRDRRNPSSAFIYQETAVRGIYGNMDVDSAIYSYQTVSDQQHEFWLAIEAAAQADKWTQIEDLTLDDNARRFLRIRPKTGQEVLHSVEETRISLNPITKTVVVAWVQSDQRQMPKRFPTDGPEGGFANSIIWPRFAAESARANGS